MSLTVTVQDAGIGLALTRMTAMLRSMQPVYRAVGAKLEQNVHIRMDAFKAPDGKAWAAWAPATARTRAASGRGTLLSYTGRMRASLTHFADNQGAVVGFGVAYAAYHETGTKRMPKRPLLFDNGNLGRDDLDDALKAAMAAFRKQLPLQTP
jgi:phage virion morphogenesis protein